LEIREREMDEHAHEEHHLADFREAKDEFMRDDPHSPLSDEQRQRFAGLSYYPFNLALHLHLPLDREVAADAVPMQTSTGEQQEYRRAGKLHFDVDGQAAQLTVFQDPEGELFLPLRDATSGKETYGAGRYLEPEWIDDQTVHVDFNYLYNPYCAYNEAYSCPLPPRENWLRVPIAAGEKGFQA
jgi:uncharacterized protein (DUF1684 family)